VRLAPDRVVDRTHDASPTVRASEVDAAPAVAFENRKSVGGDARYVG
jgi:hypothetical protein